MINNLLRAIRNFKRSPLLFFVSLTGLSIGLTAFLLLMVYIKHETSYDQSFPNNDRVVRLYNTIIEKDAINNYPICLRSAYTEIPQQVPEIELATQIYRGGRSNVFFQEKQFNNQQLLYVDPEFFNVFGLTLIAGNKKEALKPKFTVVIAESLAKKIFSNNKCIGKVIKVGDKNFTVTGVIKDMPVTTHFHFDLLASMNTLNLKTLGGLEFFTYYLLNEKSDFHTAKKKIASLNDKTLYARFASFMEKSKSGIERLTDLHLHSITDFDLSEKANITYVYVMIFLSVFILLIAIVNHINLFVLHSEKRSLEIGIRKSLGASHFSLIILFYFETAILIIAAFAIALLSTSAALPVFARIIQVKLNIYEIINPVSIVSITGFMLLLIFISGAYPAFYLSRLSVVSAIKGGSYYTIHRKKWLSVSSVVVQFSISVFLIICLLVINSQLRFLKNIPLGFHSENVIGINGFGNKIGKKAPSIKDEISKLTFVKSVGTSAHFMGGGCSGQIIYPYGASEKSSKSINEYRVQAGFCKTMQLQLEEGRFFNGTGEDKRSIILNRAAVKMMGWDNAVGKTVVMFDDPLKVIGVVKDFYYDENAGESIKPLALTAYSNRVNVFYLRIYGNLSKGRIDRIATIFSTFDKDYRLKYFKLNAVYTQKFSKEDRLLKLLLYGTLLAIFLSFTGMFALSVLNVEKRTKEIGIRKVLGSSSFEVLIKLLSDTLKWVIWSMIPAFLLSYILMNDWLMQFANRIELNVIHFITGGFIALAIAFVAISIQSIRAARSNPVNSLRYE